MSEQMLTQSTRQLEALQARVQELGREALEGSRPLSALLGESLAELRAAMSSMREMEAELARTRAQGSDTSAGTSRAGQRSAAVAPAAARSRERNGGGEKGWEETGRRASDTPSMGASASPKDGSAAEASQQPAGAPVDFLGGPIPEGRRALESSLQARIAGALYLGMLSPGDRLPSIREVSRWTGLNHKVVRRVYHSLATAGYLEIRDRSGIYVAGERDGLTEPLDAQREWIADVVAEAVERGLGAHALPALLVRSIAARPLRCACVDSTEDDRAALCHEIAARFGVETRAIDPGSADFEDEIGGADFIVTTPCHRDRVPAGLAASTPCVVANLHPGWRREVEAHTGPEPLRVLCVDPATGERLLHSLGPDLAPRVRIVPAERPRLADGSGATVATQAAWARLSAGKPIPDIRVLPYLSARTTRRLARVVVALNRNGT